MPALEAPSNFDEQSSPENSIGQEFIGDGVGGNGGGVGFDNNNIQMRARSPEHPNMAANLPIRTNNNFGGLRLPTIRLQNQRIFIEPQLEQRQIDEVPVLHLPNNGTWLRITPAPPPVVNLLPVNLPPQITEPQLDELLRRVTQRNDLHNVETVRLRVISAITVSLSRLSLFLPRLQHLDLSGSVLNSLRDLGCGLVHLNHLNVSNCGLNSFDGTSGMPAVRTLIADGNMIQRVGPLSQLPLLQRLSARNNRISDLGLLTFLGMCPNLTEVELQGNPVCHLSLYRVTLLRSIHTLQVLDGTQIGSRRDNTQPSPSTEIELSGVNQERISSVLEAESVAALNRRNALQRTSSSTSTSSTNSSKSSTQTNNISNSEELSKMSSTEESLEPIASSNSEQPPLSNALDSTHFNIFERSAESEALTHARILSASNSILNVRHHRRPASTPTGTRLRNFEHADCVQPRASSAMIITSPQRNTSSNLNFTHASNIVTSVRDLARQRRQRRLNGIAWASQPSTPLNVNSQSQSPSLENSSASSSAHSTPPSSSSSSSSLFLSASNSPTSSHHIQ